jgi:hypothetical protein
MGCEGALAGSVVVRTGDAGLGVVGVLLALRGGAFFTVRRPPRFSSR